MAAVEPLEICVKAASGAPDVMGDCTSCQRVLLTLEEKHLPYKVKLVNLRDKPQWFLDVSPEGKVPVMKWGDKWLADSDVLTQLIEEKYPDPSLVTPPEYASVGSKIFPSLIRFLIIKGTDNDMEKTLLDELKTLNEHLQAHGPFVGGDKLTAVDLSLGPKLYQLEITLEHFKSWTIPKDLAHVHKYIELLLSRDSFVKTKAAKEYVIAGWVPRVKA